VGTRREKTGTGYKERKEGAECAMKREREIIEHMWKGCNDIRERERERNGEKRRKGDRMDERDMEKEGQNGKRKGWGIYIFFLIFIFLDKTVCRNRKGRRANKALSKCTKNHNNLENIIEGEDLYVAI
jgi:hypothetical protein